jgi:hypothetical protein
MGANDLKGMNEDEICHDGQATDSSKRQLIDACEVDTLAVENKRNRQTRPQQIRSLIVNKGDKWQV